MRLAFEDMALVGASGTPFSMIPSMEPETCAPKSTRACLPPVLWISQPICVSHETIFFLLLLARVGRGRSIRPSNFSIHRPPERQPQPPVARMPQQGRAQVRARSLLSLGYGGVYESGDRMKRLWDCRHLFFSQGAFPFLTTGAVAGACTGTFMAAFGSCLSIVAPPSSGLKPFTSLLSSYCPSAGLTATLI